MSGADVYARQILEHGFCVIPLDPEVYKAARLARTLTLPFLRSPEGIQTLAEATDPYPHHPSTKSPPPTGVESEYGLSTTDKGGVQRFVYRKTSTLRHTTPGVLHRDECQDALFATECLYDFLSTTTLEVLQRVIDIISPKYAFLLPMLARQGCRPTNSCPHSATSLTAHFTPQGCTTPGGLLHFQTAPPTGAVPVVQPSTDATLLTTVLLPSDDHSLGCESRYGGGFVRPIQHFKGVGYPGLVAVCFAGEALDYAIKPTVPTPLSIRQCLFHTASDSTAGSREQLLHIFRLLPPRASDLNLERVLAATVGDDYTQCGSPHSTGVFLEWFHGGKRGSPWGGDWGEEEGESGNTPHHHHHNSFSSQPPVASTFTPRRGPQTSAPSPAPTPTLGGVPTSPPPPPPTSSSSSAAFSYMASKAFSPVAKPPLPFSSFQSPGGSSSISSTPPLVQGPSPEDLHILGVEPSAPHPPPPPTLLFTPVLKMGPPPSPETPPIVYPTLVPKGSSTPSLPLATSPSRDSKSPRATGSRMDLVAGPGAVTSSRSLGGGGSVESTPGSAAAPPSTPQPFAVVLNSKSKPTTPKPPPLEPLPIHPTFKA